MPSLRQFRKRRARKSLKSLVRMPGFADRLAHEASRLLVAGYSVKEVAAQLGFAHASSFARFFKSQTGMTPRAAKPLHLRDVEFVI